MNTSLLLNRVTLAGLLGTLLLSGCSTVVQQSYRDAPTAPSVALLPYSGESKVYGSYHLSDDADRLMKEGYAQIGTSTFRTDGHVTFEEIQDEAKAVGADIVLFLKVDPRSKRAVEPQPLNNDGTSHSLSPFVHVGSVAIAGGNWGGATSVGGGNKDFNGTVTSSGIPGISSEDMAAINAPNFDYTATFWRKLKDAPKRKESMMLMGADRDSSADRAPGKEAQASEDAASRLEGHGGS
jgi:hypothetical protein